MLILHEDRQNLAPIASGIEPGKIHEGEEGIRVTSLQSRSGQGNVHETAEMN